jgi:small-conductance mechanosensitive channel
MILNLRMHWVVFLVCLFISPYAQAQGESNPAESAGPETAPVIVDGRRLFTLRGISSYPAQTRARNVRSRIIQVARERSMDPEDLIIEERELASVIMAGSTDVLGVFDVDAEVEGVDREILALSYLNRIQEAIREYRADRGSERLLRNLLYALGATIVLVLALWGLHKLYRTALKWSERRLQKSIESLADKAYNLFHAGQVWRLLSGALRILHLAIALALIYFYLNLVLGLFPWSRPFALTLFSLILTPLKAIGTGFLAALPDLFFLVILFFVVRYVIKLIRAFFNGIHYGRIRFENFDRDWAMPTYKIVRIIVIAFSLVIAYPYIPGSDSLAFKGVSVFVGVLLSLGSSSFIANLIAGLTMTYRGAFKEGDLIRVGDVLGRVEEIKLMTTRVHTPKNETVVLPNSNILNTDVVNYSSQVRDDGLVLHTTVGIGYDTPWRQVEAMLIEAAGRTERLQTDPPPFVLQKALGDFTVDYELNVFCRNEHQMPKLYSKLHANIQDVFNENGVQIMSPHYIADTDSPKVVPPDKWYTPPAKDPG